MQKSDFETDGHYSVTLRGPEGRLRPANLYVHLLAGSYMIARHTSGGDVGMLVKLGYDDVVKVVRKHPVADRKRFMLPAAVLKPEVWESRTAMQAYSSAPGLGK